MPEEALERAVERGVVVLLVEQAVGAPDALEERAVEDVGALVLVELHDLGRGQRIGRAQRAGEDAARRRAGDQVEHLEHPAARTPLELGEHERRDQAADSAAVDGQHAHSVHRSRYNCARCVPPF